MGIRSFFGFEKTDTMGPVGSKKKEAARREEIERTGHASPGPDGSRDELVTWPSSKRPSRR